MPRVLITGFSCFPAPHRAGVQLRHCVRALAAEFTVDVLVVRGPEQAYVERQGAARILRVPVTETEPHARINAYRRALRRQLEGAEYDVVHFLDAESGATVLAARDRGGFAAVFDVSRSPLAGPALPSVDAGGISSADADICLAKADLVLVPTEPAARYAAARVPVGRIHQVGVGVDVDRFDWEQPSSAQRPSVLYAGTIAQGRGLRLLLHAFSSVCRTIDADLVLVGEAEPGFEARLRGTIADLGLAQRVRIIGPVDHLRIPEFIAQATVCVAPAAAELTPRATALYPTKILEYMACRRPVLAARRSTTSMIVNYGTNGLLFDPGDPQDLARKLVRLLGDPPLRERLAAAAYEQVRAEHTASGVRRALRRSYASLFEDSRWRSRLLDGDTREQAGTGGYSSVALIDDEATVFEAIEQIDLVETHFAGEHDPEHILEMPAAPAPDHTTIVAMGDETTENTPIAAFANRDAWVVGGALDTESGARPSALRQREGSSTNTPAALRGARFVGGEISTPASIDPSPEIIEVLDDSMFSAESALLGNHEEEVTPTPISLHRLRDGNERK